MMKNRLEQIVELLADEVEQRLRRRQYGAPPAPPSTPPPPGPKGGRAAGESPAEEHAVAAEETADVEPSPMAVGPRHASRLMARLALILVVVVVAVNVPFNRFGTTLATMLPDSAAWVIVDGFVVKEEDEPEIYVFQDGQLRWISSIEAFEAYGYEWSDVHVAEDGYLDGFEIGPPLEVVVKCWGSPHVYLLEGLTLGCEFLRSLPDGETIPPGSGPPPIP
jgi:hypothetical protein